MKLRFFFGGKTHKLSFFGGIFFFKVLPCIIVKKVYKKDKKKKSVRGMIQLLSKGMIFVALFLATIFFVCSKSYLGETFLKYFPDVIFFQHDHELQKSILSK